MTDLTLYAVCWQEQGEAWGWEPLSIWFDKRAARVELCRLVDTHIEFPIAVRQVRLEIPTMVMNRADGLPETAWLGDPVLPDDLD